MGMCAGIIVKKGIFAEIDCTTGKAIIVTGNGGTYGGRVVLLRSYIPKERKSITQGVYKFLVWEEKGKRKGRYMGRLQEEEILLLRTAREEKEYGRLYYDYERKER